MIKEIKFNKGSKGDSGPDNIFSEDYFNLLLDFSKQLKTLAEKLSKDETLIKKIKENSNEPLEIEDVLPYFILYDFSKLLKILSNGNIVKTSLETFGLTLITSTITGSENWLDKGYEALKLDYSSGFLISVAETLIGFSNNSNPLSLNIKSSIDNKLTESKNIESNLSLPTFLKLFNCPLFEEYSTLLYRFANIITKANSTVSKEEEEVLKEIFQLTHNPIPEGINAALNMSLADSNETLDEVLKELESLIGLSTVKQEVKSLTNYIKIQKEREKLGLKSSQVSYHCVFTGSPGTGKTTIARIVAKIYKHLEIVSKGHLVETDRSGLVAEYSGQTAVKVNKTVNSAIDGVLFIDEAYSLVGENQDDYGREAVATLIKRMEDDRDKLIVILAGYTNEMKEFIDSNSGIKSRFNRNIFFDDYNPSELMQIFELMCSKSDYIISEDSKRMLTSTFTELYKNKDKNFGNGRLVRNVFEKTIENLSNRIASISKLTKELLITIESMDIPNVNLYLK